MTSDLVFLALWTQHHELKKTLESGGRTKIHLRWAILGDLWKQNPSRILGIFHKLSDQKIAGNMPPWSLLLGPKWFETQFWNLTTTHLYVYMRRYICIYAYMHICINMHITHTHTRTCIITSINTFLILEPTASGHRCLVYDEASVEDFDQCFFLLLGNYIRFIGTTIHNES